MINLEVLQTRLMEAETALHKLSLGGKAETITYGDQRVTYTAANVNRLRLYIADLKNQIAKIQGRRSRGPIYMEF